MNRPFPERYAALFQRATTNLAFREPRRPYHSEGMTRKKHPPNSLRKATDAFLFFNLR